jgi:Flp pilus assembly protein TadD
MARSIGRVEGLTPGTVTNPATGTRYEISMREDAAWLTGTSRDGGVRRQRIVGRIGAGIFDTSWVSTEVDASNGVPTGRVYFAPVETIAGKGHQLSPFETHANSPGLDMPMTNECVTCHTLDRVAGTSPAPFPPNQLGSGFDSLQPLGCAACHGDTKDHSAMVRIGRLAPAAQRDICARCHLQGDARIDLVKGAPDRNHPLGAQIPVLVPSSPHTDFRFVGQVERLALSECFKQSASMTCTTCHDPHTGARAQGVASFDRACATCHKALTNHASADSGCVGCHVRRSQPFDLPHIRTADHFVRRRIEPPQDDIAHRQFTAREGPVTLYDDGRLRAPLSTAAGRRWRDGVLAMGLLTMGRFAEAARHMASFPPPGSAAARTPSAPRGFAPLETVPAFHTVRGFALMGTGKLTEAAKAFSDAIELDPNAADARMARARISLDMGDLAGALLDSQAVINAYPQAEQPWDFRIEVAERSGRPDLAFSAADASTRVWPSNPRAWAKLAQFARARGDIERANQAIERARALSPSIAEPR